MAIQLGYAASRGLDTSMLQMIPPLTDRYLPALLHMPKCHVVHEEAHQNAKPPVQATT